MSDEKKPIPMNNGERGTPIPLGGRTLFGMIGSIAKPISGAAERIRSEISMSGQDRFLNGAGIITGGSADMAIARAQASARNALGKPTSSGSGRSASVESIFARGQIVRDKTNGKKATVVKLNVGFTKKGRPIHKVISKSGESWLQSERKLEKI
jgi:hypothetical protein